MTNPFDAPIWPIPFDRIEPAAQLGPAVDRAIELARARLLEIEQTATPCPAVLHALDNATVELDWAIMLAEHLEEVLGTDELRDAFSAAVQKRDALRAEMLSSDALHRVLDGLSKSSLDLYDPVGARFLAHALAELRMGGTGLDPSRKARLIEIDAMLSTKTLAFARRASEAIESFEVIVRSPSRLEGLPRSAIEAARASAVGDDTYRFTLEAASWTAVMTYAGDRDLRRDLYVGRFSAAVADNTALLSEILALRAERARLLGFETFADAITARRMMATAKNAQAFVASTFDRLEPRFREENATLASFAQRHGAVLPLQAWDVAFWAERLRRAEYGFDGDALRAYFPLARVLEGLFGLIRTMFAIDIAPCPSAPVWHEDVTAWTITGGNVNGVVYLDLFSRPSKREGAWLTPLFDRIPGDTVPSLAIVATDFAAPPTKDQIALLSHTEVTRLFHEVGHLLHHVLSESPFRKLAGTHVAWDFVELPSMLMENFAWDPICLRDMARHIDTHEPIPAPVVERMISARRFRAASTFVRDLGLAAVDLGFHAAIDESIYRDDPIGYARDVFTRFAPTPLPPTYAMVASFSHLFGSTKGYEGAFYAYPWAEVLDADVFACFARTRSADGTISPTTAAALRNTILSRGDMADPQSLFRSFVGREPEINALFARLTA